MNALALFFTLLLGCFVFVVLIPHGNREYFYSELRRFARLSQVGGYVHDTAMCQAIPPGSGHFVTGTWSDSVGATAGTQAKRKAAAAETTTIHMPISVPSNSVSGKGSMLKYVELDYEITTAAATSVTLSMVKQKLGTDTNAPTPSAPAGTQTLTAATTAATVDQHRDRFTLTTPAYIADDELYYLKIVAVCAAGTVLDIYGARAYFTERL